MPCLAGIDDEPGPSAFDHVRRENLGAVDDAPEVDRENSLPVLQWTKAVAVRPMPALFIRISVPPNRFCTAASSPATCSKLNDIDLGGHDIGGAAFGGRRQLCGGISQPFGADIAMQTFMPRPANRIAAQADAGSASGITAT